MKKSIVIAVMSFFLLAAAPLFARAELQWDGLSVTCKGDGSTPLYEGVRNNERECTFEDFITLIRDVIEFMMIISVPIISIACVWIGFLLMTSRGDPAKRTRAKEIAWSVLLGFIFIMSAFLIVYTITSILDPKFNQYILR